MLLQPAHAACLMGSTRSGSVSRSRSSWIEPVIRGAEYELEAGESCIGIPEVGVNMVAITRASIREPGTTDKRNFRRMVGKAVLIVIMAKEDPRHKRGPEANGM